MSMSGTVIDLVFSGKEADSAMAEMMARRVHAELLALPSAKLLKQHLVANPLPTGWRCIGGAVRCPDGTIAELVGVPDPQLRLRGGEWSWRVTDGVRRETIDVDGWGPWSSLYEALETFPAAGREAMEPQRALEYAASQAPTPPSAIPTPADVPDAAPPTPADGLTADERKLITERLSAPWTDEDRTYGRHIGRFDNEQYKRILAALEAAGWVDAREENYQMDGMRPLSVRKPR